MMKPAPVLYIPHGGGPLPLLGDKQHQEMIDFLVDIAPALGKPSAILVVSAHWEAERPTITSGRTPETPGARWQTSRFIMPACHPRSMRRF